MRRCAEDREFTADDAPIWPMYIIKGGNLYNYCPGKATWDGEAQDIFNLLLVSAKTGSLLYKGGIVDQPLWYIDLLSWFIPRFDTMNFLSKADMVLGGEGNSGVHGSPKAN